MLFTTMTETFHLKKPHPSTKQKVKLYFLFPPPSFKCVHFSALLVWYLTGDTRLLEHFLLSELDVLMPTHNVSSFSFVSKDDLSFSCPTLLSKLLQKEFLTIVPFFSTSYTCVFPPRRLMNFHIPCPFQQLSVCTERICRNILCRDLHLHRSLSFVPQMS